MSKGEEGFTITEALTAIGIIAASGMIALGALSSSIKGIDRAKGGIEFGVKLLAADNLIRRKTGAVNIPFWERNIALIAEDTSIQVPWYGSMAEDYLRFFWDEHSLRMETESGGEKESVLLFRALDRIQVSALTDGDGIPYGLDVAYAYGGREYHTRAAFASSPVQGGGHEK
jgi:hypothetical protein